VGVALAGGSDAEATVIAETLSLIGWSHGFYGEHSDISIDMQGIEQLIAGKDRELETLREARALSRRIVSVLYAFADRFPIFGSTFSTRRMQTRVREIQRYFSDVDGESTAARDMLADTIRKAWDSGEQVLLAGHSFGSVIAYDTLWELSRGETGGQVDLFLTMGSPLTMNYIRRGLQGANLRGADRYPTCIRRWRNLAAVGEVTALDRKLSDYFSPMCSLGLIESITDDLGLINQFHGPDGLNVHKCYGYFASRHVGELVLAWHRSTL
jgi:hypothetical protein